MQNRSVVGPILFGQNVARLRLVALRDRSSRLYLSRTRPGLNVRAVGESPAAADTMGINVDGYRYAHTLAGGAFAGIAGATFTLAITPQWVDGITGGAGWIAIALVIFAFWRPELCLVGAYFFGALAGARRSFQARQIDARPDRSSSGAAVRDDDRRARAGLVRRRAPPPRRAGRARHAVRARRALTRRLIGVRGTSDVRLGYV